MENIKKNPLSLQLNAEDFLPASNEEKQSLVVMRESVNFWKDGIRRLKKNKIAMVSFVFIIAIAIFAYLLPAVWPYSYSEQVKGSNNLAPFEYSASEQARIDAGEKVFPHILYSDSPPQISVVCDFSECVGMQPERKPVCCYSTTDFGLVIAFPVLTITL